MSRYALSLRITHPEMDASAISKFLGISPDFSYTAGDTKRTPKGTEISGVRKSSFWCHEFQHDDTRLEILLNKVLEQLGDKKFFFHDLRRSGGHLEFFIGWFEDGNSGLVLDSNLLCRIGELGIDMSFDIYGKN